MQARVSGCVTGSCWSAEVSEGAVASSAAGKPSRASRPITKRLQSRLISGTTRDTWWRSQGTASLWDRQARGTF
ncbi:hypothetical protein PI125_g5565 [Phytophthora idaei]|nr:hypothetical protein PI125_g5565 [Phytophthora idaei]